MNKALNHAGLNREGVPLSGEAGIVLRGDQDLVRACLAQGGFPRAVTTNIGTVWAGHDGKPWAGPRRKTGKRGAK